MSDSPKCLPCYFSGKIGKTGQTYRVAGKPQFWCHDCGIIYEDSSFQPIELEWKTNEAGWKKFIDSKRDEFEKAGLDNNKKSEIQESGRIEAGSKSDTPSEKERD